MSKVGTQWANSCRLMQLSSRHLHRPFWEASDLIRSPRQSCRNRWDMFREKKVQRGPQSSQKVGILRLRRRGKSRLFSSSQRSIQANALSAQQTVNPSRFFNSNWRLGNVRWSWLAGLQSHLGQLQGALCWPRHRRVHQPRREHVAEVQASSQTAVGTSRKLLATYLDEFMWRQRYKDDPFRHIVEHIVQKDKPN